MSRKIHVICFEDYPDTREDPSTRILHIDLASNNIGYGCKYGESSYNNRPLLTGTLKGMWGIKDASLVVKFPIDKKQEGGFDPEEGFFPGGGSGPSGGFILPG